MKSRTKARTTTIRVGKWSPGETWRVPRGFGAVYRRALKEHYKMIAAGKPGKIIGEIIDLLALVGYHATIEQVVDWDLRRRIEAVVYAANEYARASDNPLPRHPLPSWLPKDPWKGSERSRGLVSGPSGTPIPVEASR